MQIRPPNPVIVVARSTQFSFKNESGGGLSVEELICHSSFTTTLKLISWEQSYTDGSQRCWSSQSDTVHTANRWQGIFIMVYGGFVDAHDVWHHQWCQRIEGDSVISFTSPLWSQPMRADWNESNRITDLRLFNRDSLWQSSDASRVSSLRSAER